MLIRTEDASKLVGLNHSFNPYTKSAKHTIAKAAIILYRNPCLGGLLSVKSISIKNTVVTVKVPSLGELYAKN